jgi:hypothetical protein
MGQFRIGESVRVLVSSPAISEQVGIVVEVVDGVDREGKELFLVKFPDRFMRYYREAELGPVLSSN